MRILITGSNTINKGAEAMLRTVMAELGDRLPGATFFIGDWRARQWHPEGVVAAGVPYAPIKMQGRVSQAARAVLHGVRAPEGPVYWLRRRGEVAYHRALAEAVDGAVDVSGFLFSDQRGMAGSKLVSVVETFEREGKPFVFLPQAWGPFEEPPVREIARRVVNAATLTFARDDTSQTHLDGLGPIGPIDQSPDIAFLFRPSADGPRLVSEIGLDPNRPLLAISPNMRVYERTEGEGEDNLYALALVRAARKLLSEGVQVLIVPHEILPPNETRHDDRYLCGLIAEALGPDDVGAVTTDRSAEDLKAMIGECDLMLGSRFHALIAALSSGVPSVAVGWAHKYPELLGEFGQSHLVLDHNSLTVDALVATVSDVWDHRRQVRASIAETVPSVKAKASRAFDLTRDVLAQRTSSTPLLAVL